MGVLMTTGGDLVRTTRPYMPQTKNALAVLGLQIATERRARRMTSQELAERAVVSRLTVRKAENGDPTVSIGIVFELASIVGVDLFGIDPSELPLAVGRTRDKLALLPKRIRKSAEVINDDF